MVKVSTLLSKETEPVVSNTLASPTTVGRTQVIEGINNYLKIHDRAQTASS
jgi:hypothetical protein